MLQSLRNLFDIFSGPAERSADEEQRALQLATAVLLVEVMRADGGNQPAEQHTVVAALRDKFALSDDELAQLVAQATRTAETAYDFHHFTSAINDHFAHPLKIQIIENMWQVAYADADLGALENHLISKIAGLLYVTHGEYIAAKMRARENAAAA